MTWTQIIVLAVIQGLTEFLPISSSGHLVLIPEFFGWSDQGLVFDVAVHFGSLTAVWIYFRQDIAAMIRGSAELLRGKAESLPARMAMCIAVGTVPAAIAGLSFAAWIEANLRNPVVVASTLAVYGIVLALADRLGRQQKIIADIRLKDAIVIGVAQALALVPGTSRSGITITAAMLMGYRRQDAARFSFLLVVPVIVLATLYEGAGLLTSGVPIAWTDLAAAALISAIVAYLSIEFFMRFVTTIGLLPFAIYRLLLAGVIVYVLL